MNRIFIRIYLKYFIYWLILFAALRAVFLIRHYAFSETARAGELFMSFIFALRHDLAVTGYIMILFTFLLVAHLFFKKKITHNIISAYTILILSIIFIISIVDDGLYDYWRYRIDSTALAYIDTPKEMLASATVKEYIIAIIMFFICVVLSFLGFKKLFANDFNEAYSLSDKNRYRTFLWISVLPLLIIPARGSLGVAAVNVGSVYFSQDIFCNHLAINPVLSFLHDVFERGNMEQVPDFFTQDEAEGIFNDFTQKKDTTSIRVLKVDRPNIILFILESFGYQTIEAIGGEPGAAPNLNALIDEGLFFSNFYASGTSSRKGIVAILSGYPAQPKTSIIGFERKINQLPHMAGLLRNLGYNTMFLYGGSLDFAHMNSFVVTNGFEEIYSINNFLTETKKNKWGVHDEVTFNKLSQLIEERAESPIFASFFTLSSHEPYDVPVESKIEPKTTEEKYYRSVQYTDSCIGVFVNKMKQDKKLWDSSLVIFVADHSTRIGNLPIYDERSFHIPMLWVGGALDTTGIINKYGGQTDIINTLMSQLTDDSIHNLFGKNLLDTTRQGYAFYAYNNGFALIDPKHKAYYDNNMNKFLEDGYKSDTLFAKQTKAYYQYMLTDYLNK